MKKAFLLSIVLATTFSFCVFQKDKEPTYADSQQPTHIGTLYGIIMVKEQTKVYIPDYRVDDFEALGRTVYSELVMYDGTWWVTDPFGYRSGPAYGADRIIKPNLVLMYYYYATPTQPKLHGAYSMYNDLQSVLVAVNYLQTISDSVAEPDDTIADKKNRVLSYIRCMHSTYDSGYGTGTYSNHFNYACGPRDASFINTVQSLTPGGLKVGEFFASFIESTYYNLDVYGSVGTTYLTNNLQLIDPTNSNNGIDLIHFFCCLDGIFTSSGAITEWFPGFQFVVYWNSGITSNGLRHLVSWAGDLQQAAYYLRNADPTDIIDANYIFSSHSYGFPYSDLIADMDAINIASNVSLNQSLTLVETISDYYSSITSTSRKTIFITEVCSLASYGSNLPLNQKFEMLIDEYLGLDENGNSNGDMGSLKYSIMNAGGEVDVSIRNRIAEVFYDYFFD